MHIVREGRRSDEGIAFALDHLMKQKDLPSAVLVGGDNLTGTMSQPFAEAMAMRRRWERVFRNVCQLPMIHCCGNHDIWGWNKERSQSTGDEPLWGKNWAREQLQLDRLYYSVERNGWKIIVLDTVQPSGSGYIGGLDDAQFEWLSGEVKTPMPTVVLAHIPVTGISPLLVDADPDEDSHNVPFGAVLKDQYRIVKLFAERDNVKLVLGGHIHFEETVTFEGTTYYNSGAVSGTWWRTRDADAARRASEPVPRLTRAAPGYALLDLFEDGSFEIEQVHTGWVGEA